jgi:hypothetical protein
MNGNRMLHAKIVKEHVSHVFHVHKQYVSYGEEKKRRIVMATR